MPPTDNSIAALNTALSALSLSSSKTSAPSGVSIAPPTSEHSYFDQFAGFTPNPKAKFDTQFKSLAKFKQWSKAEAAKERTAAILFEFDSLWGTDTSKLDKWQALCEEVGLGNVPGSIKQCKQVCRGTRSAAVRNQWNVECRANWCKGAGLAPGHGQHRQPHRSSPWCRASAQIRELCPLPRVHYAASVSTRGGEEGGVCPRAFEEDLLRCFCARIRDDVWVDSWWTT